MIVRTNTKAFEKTMRNIVDYSFGFLDGVQKGKKIFLQKLGISVIEALKQYVDINARMSPESLHHVYEWYQVGSPEARLFDIKYTVSNLGLSLNATFRQSTTLSKDGSKPFYDKARIMEKGIPVTIAPKRASALVFEENGETIFSKRPVTIYQPGGEEVQGAFEQTMDSFILRYFKQSFLRASGIYEYISKPMVFKKNIKAGAKMGKSIGQKTGYTWIINASIGVENG
jgi:hypothetical protein